MASDFPTATFNPRRHWRFDQIQISLLRVAAGIEKSLINYLIPLTFRNHSINVCMCGQQKYHLITSHFPEDQNHVLVHLYALGTLSSQTHGKDQHVNKLSQYNLLRVKNQAMDNRKCVFRIDEDFRQRQEKACRQGQIIMKFDLK